MSEHIEDLLSEYIDNELNETDKQIIEKHLSLCPECSDRLDELMALRKGILAVYQPIEIPNIIEEKVMEKIQQTTLKKTAAVLNLLALITLVGFGIVLLVTASPILTVALPIFQSAYSISRGLLYAVPSIISAIPYVVDVIIGLIICFIVFAIMTLRYLVYTMGKTVRAEDL